MEVIFNIWFVVDISSGAAKNIYIKSYCMSGTDDEKFALLTSLADYDYMTCDVVHFAETCVEQNRSIDLFGKWGLPQVAIDDFLDQNMDYITTLVKDKLSCKDNNLRNIKLDSPLFVCTLLMQNERGEKRAYTSEANVEWCLKERERLASTQEKNA